MLHQILIDAFHGISEAERNALAWVALDTKFERFVLAALATSINRKSGRIAHVEVKHMDLVLLDAPVVRRPNRNLDEDEIRARIRLHYEAKAGQLFDFANPRTKPKYLGDDLNAEFAKAALRRGQGAGLFFINEAADPTRHLKYFAGHTCDLAHAVSILKQHVLAGELVAQETISCGIADGTEVKLHMCVFDPKQ